MIVHVRLTDDRIGSIALAVLRAAAALRPGAVQVIEVIEIEVIETEAAPPPPPDPED